MSRNRNSDVFNKSTIINLILKEWQIRTIFGATYEELDTVKVCTAVLWVLTQCSLVSGYRNFGGTSRSQPQGRTE